MGVPGPSLNQRKQKWKQLEELPLDLQAYDALLEKASGKAKRDLPWPFLKSLKCFILTYFKYLLWLQVLCTYA